MEIKVAKWDIQKIFAKETYSDYKYYFTDIYSLYDENPIIYLFY